MDAARPSTAARAPENLTGIQPARDASSRSTDVFRRLSEMSPSRSSDSANRATSGTDAGRDARRDAGAGRSSVAERPSPTRPATSGESSLPSIRDRFQSAPPIAGADPDARPGRTRETPVASDWINRMRESSPESPQRGRPESDALASGMRSGGRNEILGESRQRGPGFEGPGGSLAGRALTQRTIPRNGLVDGDQGLTGRPDSRSGAHVAGRPVVGPGDRLSGPGPAPGPARHQQFRERYDQGHWQSITHSPTGRRLDLDRQYRYYGTGDVARRLHLHTHLSQHGGWRHSVYQGPISHTFINIHFGHNYIGPRWYPSRVWYPRWSDWVRWSWWDRCLPLYDPRPIYCRPIVYVSCPRVVVYEYPVWQPLHVVSAGTWVDVPPVVVAPQQYDLQLLAVRFVDAGHPEQQLGPRYRVWFRNSSPQDLLQPFSVSMIAANDDRLHEQLPQASVRVEAVAAGEIQAVDLRLPWDAHQMSLDAAGNPLPFEKLHVVVDSHREIQEVTEANNGAILDRGDILPVDPAAFSTDVDTVAAGQAVSIAGEGFGPEPGQVLLYVKGLELQPEIQGWYDLGVRVEIPALPLAEPTEARLVVVRRDSAAANPLELTLAPAAFELLPAP
jgi:hypothetical protein